MAMTRHFVDAVIRDKGWIPYIAGHWIDFKRQRGGVIITFKSHEQHEYKCSHKTAKEIIASSHITMDTWEFPTISTEDKHENYFKQIYKKHLTSLV